MKIVLSSTNKAKKEAVNKTFSSFFSEEFELITVEVDSGVSETPTTDEAGIQGALNRISKAKLLIPDGDFYLGLEGIITTNKFATFICGWAVVETKAGKLGIGCSGKVKLPDFIARKVTDFKKLSELVKENYSSELLSKMDEIGSNGVITNEVYTRVDEFEDALKCAIGYLLNPRND